MQINREDMLELTRRMTLKRNCFSRIAGAYVDEDGYIEGTFNTNFLNLSVKEKEQNLAIAKKIPFSETNVEVKGYRFPAESKGNGSAWQLLQGMNSSGLKNDALLEIFYDLLLQEFSIRKEYAIMVFSGCYDVPVKGTDKAWQDESEEVYQFLIVAICPLVGEYEAGEPQTGFLFPAFTDRSSDSNHVIVFQRDYDKIGESIKSVLACQ